jgi:hypothetical protein
MSVKTPVLMAIKASMAANALWQWTRYPLALVVRGADVSESEAGKILADRVSTKLTDWSTPYQLATHTGRAIRTVL